MVKIHQIFRVLPPDDFINEVVKCYNASFNDTHYSFCKNDLKAIQTVDRINDMINQFRLYYLPCKWNYIENIDERKAITILRQIIRLKAYCLVISYRYKNRVKQAYYQIKQVTYVTQALYKKKIKIHHNPVVISF